MLDLLQTPITVLHVLVCLMLMLVVLIQPGKSGGLGAALGGAGAQQIFGGRGAGNFLTRTTWIAATVFFLTSVTLAYVSTSTGDSLEDLAGQVAPAAVPEEPAEPERTAPANAAPAAGDSPIPLGDSPAQTPPPNAGSSEPAPTPPAP
jgi:preprotein translocase subunit SecG